VDDLILHLKYLKTPSNTLRSKNTFIKVSGCKINVQKSAAHLYINNEQFEKEIRETISFMRTSKKIKFKGKFNKVKNLNNKNYKLLKKATEEYQKMEEPHGLVNQ
jgi:hypothetical protein